MNDDQKNYWQPNEGDTPESPAPKSEESPVEDVQLNDVENEEVADPNAEDEDANDTPVTWQAQEYVHPEKNGWWYVIFGLVVIALIAFDIFLMHVWTFSVLVVVMAVALIVYIRRPPRDITYALSPKHGLYIGEKLYHFEDFKAFGLIRDGEHYSIMLIPRKRFSPGVSVFFPDDAGEAIVDILGQRLPMQELKLDVLDLVVRKLRL